MGLTRHDQRLAKLSPEELRTLEAIARKLARLAPDASHNQTESNTATQVADVRVNLGISEPPS